MEVKITHCTCKHAGQDEMYGNGNRLFNPMEANGKLNGYRCSVCGKEIK